MKRYELTDQQWQRLEPLLPPERPPTGQPNHDHRIILNGILWVLRTGAPWRDLPERFGCGVKVQTRFSRWAKAGVWERVFQHVAADADNEDAMIDSTIVRAHQHAAGAPKKQGQTRRSGAARAG